MLSEYQLEALPYPLQKHFKKIEENAIKRMCNRIGKIGELTAGDAARLNELQRIGYDLEEIRREISAALGKSEKEIYDIFYEASKAEYDGYKANFDLSGTEWVPFEKNEKVQDLIESVSRTTFEEFKNITQTTGFVNTKKWDELNKTFVEVKGGIWQPLPQYYKEMLEYSVLQVRNGQTDFYSAMRSNIKSMSDYGLTRIEYNNEGKRAYRRRVDSSIRNAMMGGQQRISRHMAAINGEKFGATGMEISWHSGARPTHQDFAGKQFSMAEYVKICVPLLEDYNCYHRAFPIILGLSTPTYSQEQLDSLNAKERETIMFDGHAFNRYEATQMQRKMETSIRAHKDRAVAFGALGDKEQETLAKAKVTALNQKYVRFSKQMGLPTWGERTAVAGYTRGKSPNNVQSKIKSGDFNLRLSIQNNDKHVPGTSAYDKYFASRKAKGIEPQSIISISKDEVRHIIDSKAGTGKQFISNKGDLQPKEYVDADKTVGKYFANGEYHDTIRVAIHYSKKGTHIVPVKEES